MKRFSVPAKYLGQIIQFYVIKSIDVFVRELNDLS